MMSYFTAGRPIIPSKIGYVLKPNYLRANVHHGVLKLVSIKIVSSNEKVNIKFFGTEGDMKLNCNSTFDFQVKDIN